MQDVKYVNENKQRRELHRNAYTKQSIKYSQKYPYKIVIKNKNTRNEITDEKKKLQAQDIYV